LFLEIPDIILSKDLGNVNKHKESKPLHFNDESKLLWEQIIVSFEEGKYKKSLTELKN